jgi:hypothetical protein
MIKEKLGVGVLIILLFLPIVFGAGEVVQVQQTQQPNFKTGGFFSFLKNIYFWYAVIGLLVVAGIVVGLFFLIRFIITFIKNRNDIFWRMRTERIKLARIHSRYNSKHWWKVEKNTPVRLVKKENGKLVISNPVAYHRGDYVTHEGNFILSMNLRGNKKWFIFPITSVLIIPNQRNMEVLVKDKDGKAKRETIDKLPKASDVIQFNDNEVLIYAESLSSTGMFYVPVLKDKDDKLIDLSLPVYNSLKEVILGDYLYEQTDEFTKLAKKSMDINPNLRYEVKSKDSNQAIEVPQKQGQG